MRSDHRDGQWQSPVEPSPEETASLTAPRWDACTSNRADSLDDEAKVDFDRDLLKAGSIFKLAYVNVAPQPNGIDSVLVSCGISHRRHLTSRVIAKSDLPALIDTEWR
ncbi:hypothetical protein ANI02nite_23950 [Acetobacter nitrogenifigens DSM 23921 = NBRC 105050]|uniref:Uncharacterized protein n=1 Tax=Acetobacter nitrogenifigens DSM 23921 = NBRC 105050 TaxID=1120919 RepID=A0A511XCA3_9PROT|nr:hypothetical protein ANI02nite_23950 [Acetobacter nitrogenifigens DSM 23921 = NBRC 105050]